MEQMRMQNFIGGEWQDAESGAWYERENPARTRDIIGRAPLSDARDVDRAVAAAKAAYPAWRAMSAPARGAILHRAADCLAAKGPDLAVLMARETGKPIVEAEAEAVRAADILRFFAAEAERSFGEVYEGRDAQALLYTRRTPLGVVGIISPWNFPLAIPAWKIAPSLVFGNTVVFKPSREAAHTAGAFVACLAEAGLPPGVLNLVVGGGETIGQAIAAHPDVVAVSFTGSNAVGSTLAQTLTARGAKIQLELGGKNPAVVLADADLDLATELIVLGAVQNAGQRCTATSRVIVERDVYEPLRERLLERFSEITVGDPLDRGTLVGPLVSAQRLKAVLGMMARGEAEGAKRLYGGERLSGPGGEDGYFVRPALFDAVSPESVLAQEEIFGPVLSIIPVRDFEEGIAVANGVRYGLSAAVFTNRLDRALAFAERIDAGVVRINGQTAGVEPHVPFGGMKASSSYSREQGRAAIEFFTQTKTVTIRPPSVS
ncbi:MAG: aldehyde dehydrogenase family protein [Hydrogenibacillus sp.]|nr:aldehyde dehydrogenase family protein [Hydrogenibacillus sp.]